MEFGGDGSKKGTRSTDKKLSASYNTTSNRTRIVKTPGGELRVLHIKKRGTAPKCGDCGTKLPGVSSHSRPRVEMQTIRDETRSANWKGDTTSRSDFENQHPADSLLANESMVWKDRRTWIHDPRSRYDDGRANTLSTRLLFALRVSPASTISLNILEESYRNS